MNKADLEKLQHIFMPLASQRREEARQRKQKFIHYTTAEAAVKILQSRVFWMRNVRALVDYSEVEYGKRVIEVALNKHMLEFKAALDAIHPGAADMAINAYNRWRESLSVGTFVASVSEHSADDAHGRLSMWTSFGKSSPTAALVLNLTTEEPEGDGMDVFFSPVAYLDEKGVEDEVLKIIANIKDNETYLKSRSSIEIVNMVAVTLTMAVVCLKHPGFKEEREWRGIYLSSIFQPKLVNGEPVVKIEIEHIGGVPQQVAKLPLKNIPSLGVENFDITEVIDEVIIGPSPYWPVMYTAIVMTLVQAGITDAKSRIRASGIPVRP